MPGSVGPGALRRPCFVVRSRSSMRDLRRMRACRGRNGRAMLLGLASHTTQMYRNVQIDTAIVTSACACDLAVMEKRVHGVWMAQIAG